MFLIAVTRDRLAAAAWQRPAIEIPAARRHLTVVTDELLAEVRLSADRLDVVERPPGGSGHPDTCALSRAAFDRARAFLEIFTYSRGGRPLYYALTAGGDFYCSTHIAALRRVGLPIEENPAALPEFFLYCQVTPPRTIFKDIAQVPYAGSVRIEAEGDPLVVTTTDGCAFLGAPGGERHRSDDEIVSGVLTLLSESLLRLSPWGPTLTTLMSGGLDSSILARLAKDLFGASDTYSTGYPFEDPAVNIEREYALSAAEALGLTHKYFAPSTSEYLFGLLETIAAVEEPVHGLQTVLLSVLLSKGLPPRSTILLCGQGADGYIGLPIHARINRAIQLSRLRPVLSSSPVQAGLRALSNLHWRGRRLAERLEDCRLFGLPLTDPDHPLWGMERFGDAEWVGTYFHTTPEAIVAHRLAALRPFSRPDLRDLASILDLLTAVRGVQGFWSKVAEAAGRGIVYPFTEDALLRHVFDAPWDFKLASPKHLARQAARRLAIPEFIITRPKASFGISAQHWACRGSTFEPLVALAAKVVPLQVLREVQKPRESTARIYWNLLNYALWRRLVVDGESREDLRAELADSMAACRTEGRASGTERHN